MTFSETAMRRGVAWIVPFTCDLDSSHYFIDGLKFFFAESDSQGTDILLQTESLFDRGQDT